MSINFLSIPEEIRQSIYVYIYCNDEEKFNREFSGANMMENAKWLYRHLPARNAEGEVFGLILTFTGALYFIAKLNDDFAADIERFFESFEYISLLTDHQFRIMPLLERAARQYELRPASAGDSDEFKCMTCHIGSLLEIISKGVKNTYSCLDPETSFAIDIGLQVRIHSEPDGSSDLSGELEVDGSKANFAGDIFLSESSKLAVLQYDTKFSWQIGVNINTDDDGLTMVLESYFSVDEI